jgi:hypothetical protein
MDVTCVVGVDLFKISKHVHLNFTVQSDNVSLQSVKFKHRKTFKIKDGDFNGIRTS